jgi:hypothetical protein
MSERKNLTITEVGQITSGDRKDGKGKWQSLPFKAKDGDKELSYSTFRTSLFDAIKQGATIQAEVEVKQEGDWINRRVVQIYVEGQPIGVKGQYRGKSPEELTLSTRAYALSYSKDLVVSGAVKLEKVIEQADVFYTWLTNSKPKAPPDNLESELFGGSEVQTKAPDLKSLKFKNAGEFYTACLKELKLSKSRVDGEIAEYDLTKPDQRDRAWQTVVEIYGHKLEP